MAKKPQVSKTQAVRDYLKAHPGAMSKEIAAAFILLWDWETLPWKRR